MRLLILGGTGFLGRHLVEAALDHHFEVTLFHRGQTAPELFPDIEAIRGDRDHHLDRLGQRRFDAVIDTCGYFPPQVRASAEYLLQRVEHYTFISTVSVYADFSQSGLHEGAATKFLEDETATEIPKYYGALKRRCEEIVAQLYPDRSFFVRPGLIIGPYDASWRFAYWPRRIAEGGEVLAPGDPKRQVQYIDVRDLSAWILRMIKARATGIYNASGPKDFTTMDQMLEACRLGTGSEALFTWVSKGFLNEHEVGPWIEMPLWLSRDWNGMLEMDNSKALESGLCFRSLEDTAIDTLTWIRRLQAEGTVLGPDDDRPTPGLTAEREAELLRAWHQHRAS